MNDVLKIFLSMSLSGSLLILIFFAGKHFLKERVSRQWQYYIWLIVIARLLLPFAPETNLMGTLFQTIDHTIVQSDTVQPSKQNQSNLANIPDTPPVDGEQENVKQTETPPIYQPVNDMITLLVHNIWLVWLTVALILLIQKVTVYKGFVRYVKAGQIPISDTELLDRLAVIGEQAGVKKPVELCLNPLMSSPLLIGFFNPCIVLPSTDISEKDFRYIVLHELTHYRRRDMFYKWLVQVTVCLHWFNPLVYLMSREINKACEFSCDEGIISKSDSNSAQEYGKTLLDTMAKSGNYRESLASVTLNENKEMLKERLGAIMSFKKKSLKIKILTMLLTLVLCYSATTIGVYAMGISSSLDKTINSQDTEKSSDYITFNRIADGENTPLKIHISEFIAGDSITDSYITEEGTICSGLFTWNGKGFIKLVLHPLPPINEIDKEFIIENGVPFSIIIPYTGYYMITIENYGEKSLNDFDGELKITNKRNANNISSNDNGKEEASIEICSSDYTEIASFNQESDALEAVIPISLTNDNQPMELGFRCDNSMNYLTAFIVPESVNSYFLEKDYKSFIEPYQNGIYVDYPFKDDEILKSVIMVSRGFFGSTQFKESQIIAENTNKNGIYYIYFISEEKRDCSLSVRIVTP